MIAPRLNLLVLRCADIDRAATFYSRLGFHFTQHAHGKGPIHHAAETGGTVFELYPQTEKSGSSAGTRLGFAVENVDAAVTALIEVGAVVVTPAADSEWGRRAVIRDLDGHTVELVKSRPLPSL